jgi:electron transport complex protein RnfG
MSDEKNSSDPEQEVTLSQSALRNGIVLAIFALISVMLTAATWVLTKDRIQSEKEAALLRAIDDLIPKDEFDNDPYTDCILITDEQWLGSPEPQKAWRLRDSSDRPVGVIISSVAPNGYTGAIEYIAGFRVATEQPQLAGVRVTSHQETPGLGDKIDEKKSDWIYTLNDHDVSTIAEPKWQVKKDGGEFDGFTGATITPRALLKAVTNTTTYFRNNQDMLFSKASNCAQAEDS